MVQVGKCNSHLPAPLKNKKFWHWITHRLCPLDCEVFEEISWHSCWVTGRLKYSFTQQAWFSSYYFFCFRKLQLIYYIKVTWNIHIPWSSYPLPTKEKNYDEEIHKNLLRSVQWMWWAMTSPRSLRTDASRRQRGILWSPFIVTIFLLLVN